MFKNKPVTLLIASGLMIVLVALSCVLQFTGNSGRPDMMGGQPGTSMGDFPPGEMPNDGSRPEGGQPPSDRTMPEGGSFDPGSMPDGSNSLPDFQGNNTSMKLLQLLRGIQMGAIILISLLGILSVVGILIGKPWGRILAIVAASLLIVASIPTLFQRMFGLMLVETIAKIVLGIAVVVLCLLSKSRQVTVNP